MTRFSDAQQIPEGRQTEFDEIPWQAIAGIRDVLILHYFGVDCDIVWDVVQTQLTPLGDVVDELLSTIE